MYLQWHEVAVTAVTPARVEDCLMICGDSIDLGKEAFVLLMLS